MLEQTIGNRMFLMLTDQVSGSSCGRKVLHCCHGSWFLASFSWSTSPHTLLSSTSVKDRPSLGQKHSVSKSHGGRRALRTLCPAHRAELLGRGEAEPLISLQLLVFKQLCEMLCCFSVQSCCTNDFSLRLWQFSESQKGIPLWWWGETACREYLLQRKPGLEQTVS